MKYQQWHRLRQRAIDQDALITTTLRIPDPTSVPSAQIFSATRWGKTLNEMCHGGKTRFVAHATATDPESYGRT